jgi:(p)ppGpp synthase/HD superfamily hydrolase
VTTLLELAESISRAAHHGQTEESTGDDYILHVIRVAALVDGVSAKAVAWLHDVIEDSDLTLEDLEKKNIPPQIVWSVDLLTRHPDTTYQQYIKHIKRSRDHLAVEVKIADLKDHLRPNCPERLVARYKEAWLILTGSPWSGDV